MAYIVFLPAQFIKCSWGGLGQEVDGEEGGQGQENKWSVLQQVPVVMHVINSV